MREGWRIVKLDEIISFERGLTYAKGDEVAHSSVGVLRSNNVDLTTQSLNLDEIKYLREDFEVPEKKKVRKSSLLMCMSNGSKDHLGKVALIDEDLDYAFGGFMGLLTPDETKVVPKYLYYALASKSFKDYIHSLADGANINNLKYKDLAAYAILLLPLPEQQRIVDILDREFAKIDALKANAEKSLQAARDLFQATLKKELEPKERWEIKAFDACIEKSKAPTKLLSSSYQEKGQFPIVSQEKDLISGYWDNHEDLFVHRKPVVVFGDHTMVVKYIDFNFVVGADGVKILEPKDFLLPKYFFYWVSSVHIKRRGYARHFRYLRESSIPIPSIPEQQRIVDILDNVSTRTAALKDNANKMLSSCDDLKQSLLRKAFNGEL